MCLGKHECCFLDCFHFINIMEFSINSPLVGQGHICQVSHCVSSSSPVFRLRLRHSPPPVENVYIITPVYQITTILICPASLKLLKITQLCTSTNRRKSIKVLIEEHTGSHTLAGSGSYITAQLHTPHTYTYMHTHRR